MSLLLIFLLTCINYKEDRLALIIENLARPTRDERDTVALRKPNGDIQ
jgi:hypothetical protein